MHGNTATLLSMVKHANEFRSWDKLKASLRSQIRPAYRQIQHFHPLCLGELCEY